MPMARIGDVALLGYRRAPLPSCTVHCQRGRYKGVHVRSGLRLAVGLVVLFGGIAALAVGAPLASATTGPAGYSLPYSTGQSWSANGPHQWDDANGARNSVDLDGGDGKVRAAAAGTVTFIPCNGGGHMLMIDHAGGWHTSYYHVTNEQVSNGQAVSAGDWIANIGEATPCGGSATANHVHFSLWYYSGSFSWGAKATEAYSLDGFDIGGWTIHQGSSNYLGSWSRDADGYIYNVPASGFMSCGCVNNNGPSAPAGPASISVSNNHGQMAVQLTNFPTGVSYYFCHTGDPAGYPGGGSVPNHGQFTISASNQSWSSGLCAGAGNFWIGIQATDGNSYYSNQVVLSDAPPSVAASNNAGQLAVQLANFPTGVSYYFCHTGDPAGYPGGGSVPNHGQFTISASNQSWSSGLCAGAGNFLDRHPGNRRK